MVLAASAFSSSIRTTTQQRPVASMIADGVSDPPEFRLVFIGNDPVMALIPVDDLGLLPAMAGRVPVCVNWIAATGGVPEAPG